MLYPSTFGLTVFVSPCCSPIAMNQAESSLSGASIATSTTSTAGFLGNWSVPVPCTDEFPLLR
jgi:hypothetical protein